MMHWIFIALFIVTFWNLLKLEKEITRLKRLIDAQETYISLVRDRTLSLTKCLKDTLKILKSMKEEKEK